MLYKGKEYTTEEFIALMEQKEDQIRKFEEEKTAEAPAAPAEGEAVAPAAEGEAAAPAEGEAAAPAAEELNSEGEKAMSEKKLTEDNRKLNERIVMLEEKDRVHEIDKKLNAYKAKGVPPVVVEKAREIMLADKGAAKSYRFSEENKEVTRSLTECAFALLDTVGTIEFSENTATEFNGSADIQGDEGKERNELIKQYSEENKCDWQTAYHKLLSDGKIEEIKVL